MDDPKEEDIEAIRRAIIQSRSRPINLEITDAEVKKKVEKDHDKEVSNTLVKQFEQGYQSLIEEISNHAVEGSYSRDETIKPTLIENFQISPEKLNAIKQIISGKDAIGQKIDEICNFSPDVQLLFYEIGTYFYEQALYQKSIDIFMFLTMMNPSVQSFWIGLGLGYEKNLNLPKAIESLEGAIQCDPSDFNPFYGLLRCCEAIKDYSKLKELLKASKENAAIKEQVEDLLEYLKSKSE